MFNFFKKQQKECQIENELIVETLSSIDFFKEDQDAKAKIFERLEEAIYPNHKISYILNFGDYTVQYDLSQN